MLRTLLPPCGVPWPSLSPPSLSQAEPLPWDRGKASGVLELSEEAGGPARTYDVAFDDDDQEDGVLARHVRSA